MNIQTPGIALSTADDFLAWNEGREGRREFVDGRIVEMMTGVSKRHWKLAMRLHNLVSAHLDEAVYDCGTADFGVRTSRSVRYPDYIVERAGGHGGDLATSEPIFLAEILSPSSLATDFGPKVEEYLQIPTLRHYLVLSQDEPRIWLWSRAEGGFEGPVMTTDIGATVTLDSIGVVLALADLYRGIA